MFLKYLMPFDRLVINSPYRIDEARERLESVTVTRHLFQFWDAVPGTFEGSIDQDRFSILTSAEGYQVFGWEHSRNTFRPVCTGQMMPAPGGCRIEVHMRPILIILIFPLVWLAIFGSFLVQSGFTVGDLTEFRTFGYMIAFVFGINYLFMLGFFWHMRGRAKAALLRVLT